MITKTSASGGNKVHGTPGSPQVDDPEHNNMHEIIAGAPSPVASMVTKHSNGTLNLWQITFADRTKFSQVCSWYSLVSANDIVDTVFFMVFKHLFFLGF